MPEPVVVPVVEPVVPAVEPVVEPVVPPVTPTAFFGTDGVLNEGWQGTLGEDIREEKSLMSFKSVGDLAKSFVNTKKMVGANVIPIPTDITTEGEWQEFHKAGGRPDTVADYNLKAPDGFPEEALEQVFPKARLEAWQERFFKGGVSKKSADLFIAEFANDMIADIQAMNQASELEATELKSGLATKWGAAFEQRKHLGNIAIEEGTTGDDALKERLLAKPWINDPDFVEYSSNLGGKFSEGKPPSFTAIPTPSIYQDQIDALMADPLYLNGTQPQRLKIAEKIMAIRKLMKPEPAITA